MYTYEKFTLLLYMLYFNKKCFEKSVNLLRVGVGISHKHKMKHKIVFIFLEMHTSKYLKHTECF